MNTIQFTPCAVLLLAWSATAQERVAVFEGAGGGVGSIALYDAASGVHVASPVEFANLAWIPFDFAGRTELDEFSPTRPRRFTDVAGASRLRLQHGIGSLYHFARAAADGSASYGYLLIAPTGRPRILFERAGVGTGAGRNPFLSLIAVAPDGASFLAATQGEAGGNLFEIATIDTPSIVDRTANLPPARIYPSSLALGFASGFAVTNFGVLRFDRASALDAAFIPFGADLPPTWFSGQLVQSNDTSHVVFTAGTAFDALHVYSAGASGDARRATVTPGVVGPAGSAADGASGPWLAVSDDGVWCAWRTSIGVTHECMVSRAVGVPTPALQLSADANFLDTLDEVALFAFRGPSRLLFAVGEQNPGGPPGKLDLFAADLAPASAPQISNLTQTSGQATAPFTVAPVLKPGRAVFLPDRSGIVIHDDAGQQGQIYVWRDGQPGLQLVLAPLKDLLDIDFGGPGAVFAVRRDNGVHSLYRTDSAFNSAPILVASSTNGTTYSGLRARSDGWTAFVEKTAVGETLKRVDSLSGAIQTLSGGPALFGAAIGWSGSGRLLATRIQNGVSSHIAWTSPLAPVRLFSNGGVGQVLLGD
ncbi:MAG: hypothetical protein SGI72_13595 [Planctomycetota bacterium]|nr:hypothetical protein [Planctomycetota bacterium]